MAEPTQETVVTGQNDAPVEIRGHRSPRWLRSQPLSRAAQRREIVVWRRQARSPRWDNPIPCLEA